MHGLVWHALLASAVRERAPAHLGPADGVLASSGGSATPAPTTGPEAPRWARELSHRIGVSPTTLLEDWREDRERYSVNLTARVVRETRGGVNVLALPPGARPAVANFTVGVLQMSAVHGEPNASMAKAEGLLARGPKDALDLLVLPELALTGYAFDSASEASLLAESDRGRSFEWAARIARQRSTHVSQSVAHNPSRGA